MKIHLKVDIEAGPRTLLKVAVYSAALKNRTIKFANKKQITEAEIATWIQEELTNILTKIQDTL